MIWMASQMINEWMGVGKVSDMGTVRQRKARDNREELSSLGFTPTVRRGRRDDKRQTWRTHR